MVKREIIRQDILRDLLGSTWDTEINTNTEINTLHF